ncbi:hypothetical protein T492DRAFT_947090 [Pavlovales sp. CCMP2436]|nr:hypothetical protein T492DRAFT_947090 [Pavlovales sp. CCMP2436]
MLASRPASRLASAVGAAQSAALRAAASPRRTVGGGGEVLTLVDLPHALQSWAQRHEVILPQVLLPPGAVQNGGGRSRPAVARVAARPGYGGTGDEGTQVPGEFGFSCDDELAGGATLPPALAKWAARHGRAPATRPGPRSGNAPGGLARRRNPPEY